MRTTLTIDDDVAGILRRRSRKMGQSFKEVVNAALRRGLMEEGKAYAVKVVTRPAPLGLRAGLDPDRMNQLADEIEAQSFLEKEIQK